VVLQGSNVPEHLTPYEFSRGVGFIPEGVHKNKVYPEFIEGHC